MTVIVKVIPTKQELVSWIWWLSVVSTLFYVVFFAVGPGSIPWMITAELFSQGPRPAAMSVAVLINWCANFLVAIGFPTMQVQSYQYKNFTKELNLFKTFLDHVGELHFSTIQRVSRHILGVHVQKSTRN